MYLSKFRNNDTKPASFRGSDEVHLQFSAIDRVILRAIQLRGMA